MDLGSVKNLLRSGRPSLVVGLAECEWFEIKRGLYGIGAPGSGGERQKIELAQDVARFANGQCDAVIVLGLSEKDSAVDRVSPVPLGAVDIQQYRAVLDAKAPGGRRCVGPGGSSFGRSEQRRRWGPLSWSALPQLTEPGQVGTPRPRRVR